MPSKGLNARPANGDRVCSLLYLWWVWCSILHARPHNFSMNVQATRVYEEMLQWRQSLRIKPVVPTWRAHARPGSHCRACKYLLRLLPVWLSSLNCQRTAQALLNMLTHL